MSICGIYHIVNTLNGHFYLGSSQDIKRRWRDHRGMLRRGKHHSIRLQRAWDKYGEEAFTFVVVTECSPETLASAEQSALDALVWAKCYNVARDVERPASGVLRGCETRELLRQRILERLKAGWSARRGCQHSPEAKERMRNSRQAFMERTGVRYWPREVTQETREKMAESARKRSDRGPRPEHTRLQISETLKSKNLDYTARASKIRAANLEAGERRRTERLEVVKLYAAYLMGEVPEIEVVKAFRTHKVTTLKRLYNLFAQAKQRYGLGPYPLSAAKELVAQESCST